jgi:hypothetical protein
MQRARSTKGHARDVLHQIERPSEHSDPRTQGWDGDRDARILDGVEDAELAQHVVRRDELE